MKGFFKTMTVFFMVLSFGILTAMILGGIYADESGNVAHIAIKGEITTQEFAFGDSVSSTSIVNHLENANRNPEIEAILIEINSPGGTIVSTKEIVTAVKDSQKPVVCWLREVAASGAYWIASGCDKIVADPFTITGSIGVTGSYLEFSGLFDEYGIDYVRVVSGTEKDIGSPFKEPTEAEMAVLQKMVNEIHEVFIEDIRENRNLTEEQVLAVREASIFLGKDAQELGLVDVLGSKKEAVDLILNMTNITEIRYKSYAEEFTFSELAAGFFGDSMAQQFVSKRLSLQV